MQVRYQLRHSPRSLPEGNSRNLSQPPPRWRNRLRRPGRGARRRPRSRCRTPVGGRRAAPARRAPTTRSCPSRGSCRTARRGQPISANRPTLRQAPWVTTMPVSPGPRASRHSRRAGTHAGPDLRHGLGALDQQRLVVGQPRGVLGGEPLLELGDGQPGAGAEVVLPQPRVGLHVQAGGLGDVRRRLARPGQVAGPEARGPQRGEVRRRGGRLRVPGLVQRDVGVALAAALGVPGGLPVADQDDPAGHLLGRRRPPATGSPGSRATAARGRRTAAPPRAGCARRPRRSR